jgi:hypothetical protein
MFKNAGEKFLKKALSFLLEAGPGLSCGILVYLWGESKHKELALHHRH